MMDLLSLLQCRGIDKLMNMIDSRHSSEGLLPEGEMLGGLLRQLKIDAKDLFSQLMAVGRDLVGAVTVEEIK